MIRCYLCNATIAGTQAAANADWTAYSYRVVAGDGPDDELGPTCPDCSRKYLYDRGVHDGLELKPGLSVYGCRQETGRTPDPGVCDVCGGTRGLPAGTTLCDGCRPYAGNALATERAARAYRVLGPGPLADDIAAAIRQEAAASLPDDAPAPLDLGDLRALVESLFEWRAACGDFSDAPAWRQLRALARDLGMASGCDLDEEAEDEGD